MNFKELLLEWYSHNKRDLPWRDTTNPYKIWLSEIILQQTKVDQGLPYYLKFVKAFPTVDDLAKANEDEVLKLWQGLGYYSRARNLHFSAKYIVKNYQGIFPNKYADILELKGVGMYTAAAIASFSFSLNYAVVDGNVIRVLSRVFGIDLPFDKPEGKKQFQLLAQELLDKNSPADYNQSIMEFGALHCTPKFPNCDTCPFKDSCFALNKGSVSELPVRSKRLKVINRFLHYIIINDNGSVFIRKRDTGIWKGMYEFPFLEFQKDISEKEILRSEAWGDLFNNKNYNIVSISESYVHKLSHQKLNVKFWRISVNRISVSKYLRVQISDLEDYPVSRLIEKFMISEILI